MQFNDQNNVLPFIRPPILNVLCLQKKNRDPMVRES